MDRNTRLFFISLFLTFLSALKYGVSPFVRVFLMDYGIQGSDSYRPLLDVLGYAISFSTIYLGYRIGRESDLKNEYQGFIRSLGAGWIASCLVLGSLYLLSDDNLRAVLQLASTYGGLSGYRVGATLFASMTLGWVTSAGLNFRREWSQVILRPVLVYYSFRLLRILIQTVNSFTSLNSSNRTSIGWKLSILGGVGNIVWVWYVAKMFSSGRLIDLESDYGSVLYTFWVPSIAASTLTYLTHVAFYYFRSGILFAIPIAYNLKLVGPTLEILGLPFALLCYGYLNSKYR